MCGILGCDMQIWRVTQRLITGHGEHGNAYLVVEKTRNFSLSFTFNRVANGYLSHCTTSRKFAV